MNWSYLLVPLVLALVFLAAYLAACAGGQRWLTLREWWGRARCAHPHGRLLAIEYDGESVYECVKCGKHVRKPL